jgi:hypothetical protein
MVPRPDKSVKDEASLARVGYRCYTVAVFVRNYWRDPTHLFAEETPMTRHTRPLVVVLFLIAVALLAAACGGSGGSGTTAATATLEPVPADILVRALAAYTGPVGVVQAPTDMLTQALSVEGITQAATLTGGNPPCPGLVNTGVPDYVFEVAADLDAVTVSFDGSTMGTLMIVGPQGAQIFCNDNITTQPSVVIAQPEQGRYGVLVGRGNMSGANTGKLTVSGQ